jgi:hypothetical protein
MNVFQPGDHSWCSGALWTIRRTRKRWERTCKNTRGLATNFVVIFNELITLNLFRNMASGLRHTKGALSNLGLGVSFGLSSVIMVEVDGIALHRIMWKK